VHGLHPNVIDLRPGRTQGSPLRMPAVAGVGANLVFARCTVLHCRLSSSVNDIDRHSTRFHLGLSPGEELPRNSGQAFPTHGTWFEAEGSYC